MKKKHTQNKTKENLVPNKDIIFILPKLPAILDKDDFEQKQDIKKQEDNEMNNEVDLTRLKDEIDSGDIPKEIEFYFGGPNQNFFLMCSSLNLNKENSDFIDFLSSDTGSQIFKENMLSIHI